MDIKGKRVMIFGGWGLVGAAICHKILEEEPSELVLASLLKSEAEEACEKLQKESGTKIRLIPEDGNILGATVIFTSNIPGKIKLR